MSLLEVKNLKKVYTTRFSSQQVTALSNVSFSVEEGEYVAIMGESGSGKTTLILESLYPAIKASLNHETLPNHVKELNASWVNKVDLIDASPYWK